ncbi:hypothetical protein V2H45_16815 [Tumidithrix elongata RA019]|uniref:Uncharacterized protein n=1 Tax=Tumidithrix elongata BACA0141 TaxID=2716417 RepID=A0AAW9Q4N5_9CYAN|nr:hypothetical protein [Tumidithrix elongata RA019]
MRLSSQFCLGLLSRSKSGLIVLAIAPRLLYPEGMHYEQKA